MPRPYDRLTDDEREAVDDGYSELLSTLNIAGTGIAGDDRAEAVVDAIAIGIIESRKVPA